MIDAGPPPLILPPSLVLAKPAIIRAWTKELLPPAILGSLMVNNLVGGGGRSSFVGPPATKTAIGSEASSTTESSHTFSGQSLGSYTWIIVAAMWRGSAGARSLTSATIGGNTATEYKELEDFNCSTIFLAAARGSGDNIVLNWSGDILDCRIMVWGAEMDGLTAVSGTNNSGNNVSSLTVGPITPKKDGLAFACCYTKAPDAEVWTLSSFVEEHDNDINSGDRASSASQLTTSTSAISANFDSTDVEDYVMSMVAFR